MKDLYVDEKNCSKFHSEYKSTGTQLQFVNGKDADEMVSEVLDELSDEISKVECDGSVLMTVSNQ